MVDKAVLSLLTSGERNMVFVASIERDVADAIGATHTTDVRLSRETFFHIRDEHDHIKLDHFKMLPDAFRQGLIIHERNRPRFATICYDHPESGRRYVIPIKSTEAGDEILIQTFHRMSHRQTRSLLNRGQVLRYHR